MQLQSEKTSLVLAGAWNPAILTPQWIARNALGFAPDREFQIGMQLPILDFGQAPRITFEDLAVTATPAIFTLFLDPNKPEQIQKSIEVARTIVRLLPHTPISGVGLNFVYFSNQVGNLIESSFEGQGGILNHLPENEQEVKIVQQAWHASIAFSDHVANMSCKKNATGVEIGVNHHFDVSSAERAGEVISKATLYADLFDLSNALLKGLEDEAPNEH